MSNRGSKKKENHQNLTLKMMITSNQVQLWRYSHTRALFLPQKSHNANKRRFWPFSPKALSAKFFQQVIQNRIVQGFPTMYDMPMIYFVWPKLRSPPLWCYRVRRSTICICSCIHLPIFLSQTKILSKKTSGWLLLKQTKKWWLILWWDESDFQSLKMQI